jgi:UDP-N-acetylmuramoylalanine--D-glutamate ligase
MEELAARGVELHLHDDGLVQLERVGAVVKSPGVPAQAPVIALARARGLPVLGELELAWRLLPNELIAVTGTNGKTTTVELIGHIHREAGLPVAVAGNVGMALSALVGELDERATIVCEVSSFQLEDTLAFAPQAAVLLNITPDHLDRHGTLEAYREAKLRVFAHQEARDVAVIPARLAEIELPPGVRRVCFDADPQPDIAGLPLRGEHNHQNAMAAAAVCLARGIDPDTVREGLRTFAGVPHRLQEVGSRDGVLYVNDSKATNVASTLMALRAFPQGGIHLILGGQGKSQDFAPLREPVAASCCAVYLIGEDASPIAAALAGEAIPLHECGDLERAVAAASAAASPGETVLLSPACASFDQFADFEARGERFSKLAREIV